MASWFASTLTRPDLDAAEGAVLAAADEVTTVKDAARTARSLRLIVTDDAEGKLADVIEERVPSARVFSVGRSMEIVKDLGMACDINKRYDLGAFQGSHGIGHTRMATESRVDIAHSHPFWARPFPDISVVHNGQITNYHKLRRRLEQKGHRFATENDSEVIAVYIADRLAAGETLDSALRTSIDDLDGTFAYLISTVDGFGLARDQFATKPLLYAEDDEMVVLASEEISIRALFPDPVAGAARAAGERGPLVAQVTSEIGDRRREGPGHPGREPRDQAGDRRRRPEVHVQHPAGRHSFAVALKQEDVTIVFEGPVGWYTAGMNFGPHVVVQGNCGWAIGECMMDGRIEVLGHAGSGTAASIRGGLVYVRGDTGARAGIAMKGGTLVVGGRRRLHDRVHDAGGSDRHLRRRGGRDRRLDVRGNHLRRGSVASRGADAEVEEMTGEDADYLKGVLDPFGIDAGSLDFTKIRSGRKLWNFSTKEPELWTSAL